MASAHRHDREVGRQGGHDAGDERALVQPQGAKNNDQLDEVNAPLAILDLGHKGLRLAQPTGQVGLR